MKGFCPHSPRAWTSPNWRALGLSVLLLAALAAAFHFNSQIHLPDHDQLLVRKVEVALPPPPPPAPARAARHQTQQPALELGASDSRTAITLIHPGDIEDITVEPLDVPRFRQPDTRWEQDLSIDWEGFALDALDSMPRVLALPSTPYPRDLSRRNIHRVVVRLDVFINEGGVPSLVAIVDNPYPVLDGTIKQIISGTRFSSPTRNGKPVNARFVWPLEIRE